MRTLVLLIVIAGLFITNPSKSNFVDYLNKNFLGGSMATAQVVNSKSYWIASIYDVDPVLAKKTDSNVSEFVFIGVANSFVPIRKEKWEVLVERFEDAKSSIGVSEPTRASR